MSKYNSQGREHDEKVLVLSLKPPPSNFKCRKSTA